MRSESIALSLASLIEIIYIDVAIGAVTLGILILWCGMNSRRQITSVVV